MCLDFVAQVVTREGDVAVVASEGRRWRASTLLMPDTTPGDWVRVALGTILERLDAAEAAAINHELRAARVVAP
jgi:hydrogenase assembly chaperone HypC/HupF